MGYNLNDNLVNSAANFPNHLAIQYVNQTISYQELDSIVDRVAFELYENGIGKGDRVALLLGNCSAFVIAFYGILRSGASVVPINPTFSSREISYILENSQAKAAIATDSLRSIISSLKPQLVKLEKIYYQTNGTELSWVQQLQNSNGRFIQPPTDEEDLAVILYTSGTTGEPKGAMLSHRNMASNAESFAKLIEFTEHDRIVAVLPMFHVFCMTVCINAPIKIGGTILIAPKFSPTEVVNIIVGRKATLFAGVPTMYSFMLQLPKATLDDFSSIRACISGGASLPVELLTRFQEKYDVPILEGYGLSETAPITAFNPLKGVRKPGSIGLSAPGVMNKVVDPNGLEVPRGEVGELVVKGPNVMLGYLGMPEATYKSIKDGWFHTGDLAKMDEDDYIYIVDRIKDLIIVGGYNVYPREVEEVLYQHPAVVEAAVIGVPDIDYGESVKAYVVCNDCNISQNDLLNFAKDKLAKYKCPKEIEFLSELPKNSTGKILRRALRQSVDIN